MLSKEDQERIEKPESVIRCPMSAFNAGYEKGLKEGFRIRVEKAAQDILKTNRVISGDPCGWTEQDMFFLGAEYEHPISFNQAIDEVIKHHTNMRNLMSFWDDETGDKLKYVESHMGLLQQLIEEIAKLKK